MINTNMDSRLEPILDYNMNKIEAKAYKVGLLWITIAKNKFPEYKNITEYPKKIDPRKSILFKIAYKLVSSGIVPDSDYGLYIKAQLDIIKNIKIGNHHPLITPHSLVGEKALTRWKFWKSKFDKIEITNESKEIITSSDQINRSLEKTKIFLSSKMENIDKETLLENSVNIERWLYLNKISPYFVILTGFSDRIINFDLSKYKITDEVKNAFLLNFPQLS